MENANQYESLDWRVLADDLETLAIQESYNTQQVISNFVAVPIVTSAIFATPRNGEENECLKINGNENEDSILSEWQIYSHGRHGNPTRDFLENFLAKIEGCKYALTFSSGCSAVNAILQTFLSAGDNVIAMETIYGGTTYLLNEFKRFGVSTEYIVGFDDAKEQILTLLNANTKIVWLESPNNPTLQLVDIEEIVQAVKSKHSDAIVVVDNTFLTPIFQRPLNLGADLSISSCSKYLGGHADIILGSISTNSNHLYKKLRHIQEAAGAIPSPYDCHALIRSLKTLPIRMKQHSKSAFKVAQFLEGHPKVEKVLHPGLISHPHHKLALKQQFGHSGAIGIYLKGGLNESNKFLDGLKVILVAPSLGADVSIANLPSKRSHAEIPKDILDKQGITDNYIRFSVGLESCENLIADLNQALTNI